MDDEHPKLNWSLLIPCSLFFVFILWMYKEKWDFFLGHPLPRFASFSIGLTGFILAAVAWFKKLKVLIGLFIIALSGGAAYLFGYSSDALAILRSNNRKHNG